MRTTPTFVKTTGVLIAVGALVSLSAAPAQAGGTVQHIRTFMTGAQEAPGPGDSDGLGIFSAITTPNSLCYVMTAKKIEPAAAAHIHKAPVGVPGDIVVGLQAPTSGFAMDCITTVPESENTTETLTMSELEAIRANPSDYYVNVHNELFPAGAIRGQLH